MRIRVHTYDSQDSREDALKFIELASEALASAGGTGSTDLQLYLLGWAKLEIEKELGRAAPDATPVSPMWEPVRSS